MSLLHGSLRIPTSSRYKKAWWRTRFSDWRRQTLTAATITAPSVIIISGRRTSRSRLTLTVCNACEHVIVKCLKRMFCLILFFSNYMFWIGSGSVGPKRHILTECFSIKKLYILFGSKTCALYIKDQKNKITEKYNFYFEGFFNPVPLPVCMHPTFYRQNISGKVLYVMLDILHVVTYSVL